MELGVKNNNHWGLYPEIAASGGLTAALQEEFARQKSLLAPEPELTFDKPHMTSFAKNIARVELNRRDCQLYIAAQQRLFLGDTRECGMLFGRLRTNNLGLIAQAMNAWLLDHLDRQQMVARFGEAFQPTKDAASSEAQTYVEDRWQRLTQWLAGETTILQKLSAVANAASRRPELRQLLPYTSMLSLCFSRSLVYPFSNDCPHVDPVDESRYRVYASSFVTVDQEHNGCKYQDVIYDVLGEGDAEEAADLLVSGLPPNCGPAIYGMAEDLPRSG